MKKLKLIDSRVLHNKWMKDPKYRRAYEDLEPEFQIASQVIEARIAKKLTQSELARRIGTKQPVISRLELMESLPTISLIKRLARALDKKVTIQFS
jgi:ribosome-binding protein aMBF1 (putative translation factor)